MVGGPSPAGTDGRAQRRLARVTERVTRQRPDVKQCCATGGIGTRGRDDRRHHGESGGEHPRLVRVHEPLLQSRLLGDRSHPAARDRRRGDRAGHRRPRSEHRARLALRGAAASGAGPHRLLLHWAQLPPRLTGPAQDHGSDGRRGRRVVGASAGREHGVHRGRRRRPGGDPRRARRGGRPPRGRRRAAPSRHRRHLHGRVAEVPRPPRGDGDGREVHPPHVPHLGAGRADRQGQDRPARPPQGRGQGPHPLRLALAASATRRTS